MIFHVSLRTATAVFLIHPCDYADGSLRLETKLFDHGQHLHRGDDPRAVVDGASPQIPGIEMTRDDNDFLRMFAAFEVGEHVGARDVRQSLWRQYQLHTN